jgi:hypothetical protein
LKELIQQPVEGCKAGFGNAIGTVAGDIAVVLTNGGVFTSDDGGKSWQHIPGAYGKDQLAGPGCNDGPKIIEHPVLGWVVAGHNTQTGKRQPENPKTPYIPPEIWIRYSQDWGVSWKEMKQELPAFAAPVEPTLLWHDGFLTIIARCHGYESLDEEKKLWHYVQMTSDHPNIIPLTPVRTTIIATERRYLSPKSVYHGPWSQDTVSLNYNPVSKRYEVLATNRTGGGESNPLEKVQTLNLWSIDPKALKAGSGDWRFECSLITRQQMILENAGCDGLHPAASVIDEQRGVEHIFIYAGWHTGPSGIFRLTRTLDTEQLKERLGR